MKQIKLVLITLLSFCAVTLHASDFYYSITGVFTKGHQLLIQNDLPSDFFDKEQTIEKEFEITDETTKVNGKYKAQFYNSIEYTPKRKLVVFLYKFNPRVGKYEVINESFYFFEDTKFWFVGQNFLSPDDILAISILHKKLF